MKTELVILLHSSKTMRQPTGEPASLRQPLLLNRATQLCSYVKKLSATQLAAAMHISDPLAQKTHALIAAWSPKPARPLLALDSFIGDIYSGLRAGELSAADRDYADQTLRILSGLYGIIRPYDGICPYRLEMGYKLPDAPFANLYAFWGRDIAACLPEHGPIINVSSVEYTKAVLPFVDAARVITPRFLTVDPATGEPTFVVVHAKIARGAFARWLITSRTTKIEQFKHFAEIGYHYDASLSTPSEPVFVCQQFGGKGLSVRLS